ncbi:hypothetical protein IFM89_011782 [Coptis chinensis]|uniref:Uncharacterized protein n=1 Tax=Coptis chinensis TaxID=261450 RepID=A0A835MB13_9MAGN|nr:hypothetical protein IFM89_011782 [Coptis chinensis]
MTSGLFSYMHLPLKFCQRGGGCRRAALQWNTVGKIKEVKVKQAKLTKEKSLETMTKMKRGKEVPPPPGFPFPCKALPHVYLIAPQPQKRMVRTLSL